MLIPFGGAVKPANDFDFAVIGIPYDEKSSYMQGPAKGPAAIRAVSGDDVINAWTELGINLAEDCKIADWGDIAADGDFAAVSRRIEKKVSAVLDKEAIPILLGGDHSITYPIVRAIGKKYQALDILHFDAHPDLYDELNGDRFSHACPFKRILDKGLVQNLVQVGIRAATGSHLATAERSDVHMITMKDIPPLPELKFSNPLYVSIDVDVLDPAFAPGVSHHEPGGMSTRQLIRMIHTLDANMIGLDVVEVNPDRDFAGITAAAAAKLVMEVLGKIVFSRRRS